MVRRLGNRATVIVVAVTALVLLAGCGGNNTTDRTSATAAISAEKFTLDNWGQLAADPEKYEGASVDIVGQVLGSVERDDEGTYWQMYADPQDYDWNTIVGYGDPSFPVAEQDYVHVTGIVAGEFEGENMFGAKITAVQVYAATAEVVDATATASKPLRTVRGDEGIEQHGVRIRIDKIEFASDETRVYLEVSNNSRETAHFYAFEAKATQGSTQYDAEYQWDYPEVQSEILPGMVSSGVVVFPPMDVTQPAKLYFEASSEDYELSFRPYSWEVPGR